MAKGRLTPNCVSASSQERAARPVPDTRRPRRVQLVIRDFDLEPLRGDRSRSSIPKVLNIDPFHGRELVIWVGAARRAMSQSTRVGAVMSLWRSISIVVWLVLRALALRIKLILPSSSL